jgi:alpha-D-xyloside xylohydrolase
MPYIYSLAYEGYANGEPMISSMYLDNSNEENAYRNPQQYRFGKAFLCAPVTTPMGENGKAEQKVWIPDGIYYHFFTGKRYGTGDHIIESPLDEFPLLVRAGVPIPMQPCKSRMSECASKELTVRCYAGASGEFTLYEDDGISRKYEDGEYLKTKFVYTEKGDAFTLSVIPDGHGYRGMPTERNYIFELIGAPEGLRSSESMNWDGEKYTVRSSEMNWNEAFTLSLKKENQP